MSRRGKLPAGPIEQLREAQIFSAADFARIVRCLPHKNGGGVCIRMAIQADDFSFFGWLRGDERFRLRTGDARFSGSLFAFFDYFGFFVFLVYFFHGHLQHPLLRVGATGAGSRWLVQWTEGAVRHTGSCAPR